MDNSNKLRGLLLTVVGAAVLSVDALMVKLPKHATVWQKTLVRYGVNAAVLGALAMAERVRRGPAHTRWCREHVFAGVAMSVSNLCFIQSLQVTSAAITLSVVASAPLWAALFGRLCLGTAVFVALYGVACRAFYQRAAAPPPRSGLPPPQSILPALALAGVLDAVVAVIAGARPAGLSRHDAGWLVFQGVLVLPVSWALMSWGTKHLLAAETMLVMLLETMLGPLWVFIALGEEPSAAALVGGTVLLAVIAAEGWVTLRDERRSAYKALSQ